MVITITPIINDISVTAENKIIQITPDVTEIKIYTSGLYQSGSGGTASEIEMRNNGTYIQWKLESETTWNNLIAIADLKGADGTDGTDGREIELQNTGAYIQWRYVGDISWTNLISIASITGPQGPAGVDAPIFDKRTEWVSSLLMYQGFAPQGSEEFDAVWTIYKIVTLATGGVVSNTEFTNKKWTERNLL